MQDGPKISLHQQLEEVGFELDQRDRGAPRRDGKRESHADYHNARMRAVHKTLRWLIANEADIKAFVALAPEMRRAVLATMRAEVAKAAQSDGSA